MGTWQKAEISVYLRDAAVLALTEFPDELVDEENYTRYLPIVGEFGHPVYVQGGAPLLEALGQPALKFQEINDAELAALAARHTYLARF